MSLLFCAFEMLAHNPKAFLYYIQAVAYALAFWTVCFGRHAPSIVYLVSCLVHAILGALHHLAHS